MVDKDPLSRMSISVPSGLLKSFDEACERVGLENRSQAVQLALRMFIAEHQATGMKGKVSGVILLAYDPEVRGLEKVLVEAQHEERQIISSSVHNHLDENNCLEAVMVNGEAGKVRELADRLSRQRGVRYVKTLSFQSTN